jgi:GTP cyclohydrolase I
MTNQPQKKSAPDVKKMREAVAAFLQAAGQDPAENPLLKETPRLVADAWAHEFLDGCGKDPRALLAKEILPYACPHTDSGKSCRAPVAVKNIRFTGVCPHHLLPWSGTAHVAYIPNEKIAGYGAIAQVVEAMAHRLVLQENLTWDIAGVLQDVLVPFGVLVRLEASQPCLTLRGECQRGAVTASEAFFISELAEDPRGFERLLCKALDR